MNDKWKLAGFVIAMLLLVFWAEINFGSAQDKADTCLGAEVTSPALGKAFRILFGCEP